MQFFSIFTEEKKMCGYLMQNSAKIHTANFSITAPEGILTKEKTGGLSSAMRYFQ
jgi:hypothetical protein